MTGHFRGIGNGAWGGIAETDGRQGTDWMGKGRQSAGQEGADVWEQRN